MQKQFNLSKSAAKELVKLYDKMKKTNLSKDFVDYANAVNDVVEGMTDQNKELEKILDESFENQKDATEDLKEIAGDGIKETGKTVTKTTKTVNKEVKKSAKELMEELEDLMVEGMADGLEKQIKEVEKASERYVAKMKEARDKDKENAEYYDKIILEKERQTQDKIKKMRSDGYKNILQSAEKLSEAYNKLWQSYAPNSFYNFVKDVESITKEVTKSVDELNKQITDIGDAINQYRNTRKVDLELIDKDTADIKKLKEQIADIPDVKIPVKPVLAEKKAPSVDEITGYLRTVAKDLVGVGFNQSDIEIVITKISDVFNSSAITDDLRKIQYTLWSRLLSDDGISNELLQANKTKLFSHIAKLFDQIIVPTRADAAAEKEYQKQMAAYNAAMAKQNEYKKKQADIDAQIAEKEKEIADTKQKVKEEDEELVKLEGELAEKQKNYNSDFAKQLLINRQANKAMAEYAKTMQEVLLEQAKLGNIEIIPEDFSVYIDYQIDAIEEKIAKAYNNLELISKDISDSNIIARDEFAPEFVNYQKLMAELKAYKEAKKQTFVDMNQQPEYKGFYNNQELMENEVNLQRVRNQIKILTIAMEEGRKEQEEVNRLEQDNEQLALGRLDLMYDINNAEDEATKRSLQHMLELKDAAIANNNELINQHKETMALMGYTTEEQMQQTLSGLEQQEKAFAANTGKIMKNTALSVLQSISTMMGAFSDLMNAMGEDNAEMANFLEGVAYAQIGVNMAVGIAEAIAAGAGVAFPANLAAIATGVAAVVSGIASAISTYKQYHKNVNSPSFAEGGLIGMRYARTHEEGTRDDIAINASRGEYIIKADKVKQYGVEFFDNINYGRKKTRIHDLNFADGGYVDVTTSTRAVVNEESYAMLSEALMNMPSPEVSVMEITKVQNKVKVKESNARR